MSSSRSSLSSNERATDLDLGRLQDVVCRVEVVLGSGTVSVRDCLGLRRHSIVRLAQAAGSDLQVLVNGIPIAYGEVVIIDNHTSLRLTAILAPPSAGGAP
jgi:flagellar motor switch protein FliN